MNKFALSSLGVSACLLLATACSPPNRTGENSGGGATTGGGNSASSGSSSAGSNGTGTAGTNGTGTGTAGTNGTGSAGTNGSGAGGTATSGTGGSGVSAGTADMIDDLEDGNGYILVANGRQGPWHVFNDQSGGNQVPPYGGTFTPQSGGANNTQFAVHTTGSGYSYGGVGFDLNNSTMQEESPQSQSYNAGAFTGISFWAKGNGNLRIEFSQKSFVPTDRGGSCPTSSSCWNVYGTRELQGKLTGNWQQFTITWSGNSNFVREDGSTSPAFDPSALMDISFKHEGSNFDFWIDEVAFVRSGSSTGSAGTSGRGGTTGSGATTGAAGRGGTTGSAGTTGTAGTSGSTSCTNLGPNNNGNGSFTWYYFGQGTPKSGPNGTYLTACGYMGTESSGMSSDLVQNVAGNSPANAGYFAAIPGQSSSNFDTVNSCGACVQVTNGGKSIVATIVDECPEDSNAPCQSDPNGHLDLSWSAWNALGYSVGNPSGTTWKVVPCPVTGNVVTRIKSGNANQVFIENSILAITGVSMNGSAGTHLSYGAWQVNGNVAGQTLTLTDKAGRTLQVQANGSADQSNDTGKQFPACQ